MHILWIENDTFWRDQIISTLQLKVDTVDVVPEYLLDNRLEDIARWIFKEFSAVDGYMINLHLLAEGNRRMDCAGIKLLKLLRLYNLRQSCIVYSFLSREQFLLLNPENLILFSGGISFMRLPFDFSNLAFDDILRHKAPEDLSSYFKAESRLPDHRHFMANWWGVIQLWKVQKAINNISDGPIVDDIEVHLSAATKEMYSFQGLLSRYLNKEKEKDIEERFRQLRQKQVERFGSKQREIALIEKVLEDKIIEFEKREQKIDILKETFFDIKTKTFFQSILEKLKLISDPIGEKVNELIEIQNTTAHEVSLMKEYLELDMLITEEKLKIEEQRKQIDLEIQELVLNLEKQEKFSSADFEVLKARELLQNASPRILYIDDQADEGWSFVLQQIIFDGISDLFKSLKPSREDTVEQISNSIREECNEFKPDLIILDLRLKGEQEISADLSAISGIQVLKNIRQNEINSPILILTASNKAWSYQEALYYGAATYCIKEGLDEHRTLNETIENYLSLVQKIAILCLSDEFRFLKELKQKYAEIKCKTGQYWWENNLWLQGKRLEYPKTNITGRDQILTILQQAVRLFEDYLQSNINHEKYVFVNEYFPSLIITRLSLIVEIIHNTDNPYDGNNTRISLSKKINDQTKNELSSRIRLIDIRNSAVHNQNCRFDDLKLFSSQLFDYLNDIDSLSSEEKLEEPKEGGIYSSELHHAHQAYPERYFIKNPGLKLQGLHRYIILDTRQRSNYLLSSLKLKPGDMIEFELSKSKTTPPNYYAIKAKIIEKR